MVLASVEVMGLLLVWQRDYSTFSSQLSAFSFQQVHSIRRTHACLPPARDSSGSKRTLRRGRKSMARQQGCILAKGGPNDETLFHVGWSASCSGGAHGRAIRPHDSGGCHLYRLGDGGRGPQDLRRSLAFSEYGWCSGRCS